MRLSKRLARNTVLRRLVLALEANTMLRYAAWRGWRPGSFQPVTLRDLRWTRQCLNEEAVKEAARKVAGHTLVSWERLWSLWWQVAYLDRAAIPGALVECGVAMGGAAGMMALAHMASVNPPTRALHLFDSFRGIHEPLEIDGARAAADAGGRVGGALTPVQKGTSPMVSRELLVKTCGYRESLLCYHVGWFQETLPKESASVGPIALLRLDCDWYESTRLCLEWLYNQVSPGGLVVVDDYGHYEGCRKAVDEFMAKLPHTLLHQIDYTGVYWVKGSPRG
jgi:O-methyltransferase